MVTIATLLASFLPTPDVQAADGGDCSQCLTKTAVRAGFGHWTAEQQQSRPGDAGRAASSTTDGPPSPYIYELYSVCGEKDLNDSLDFKITQYTLGTCNKTTPRDDCTTADPNQVTKFLTRRPRTTTTGSPATNESVGAPFCADRKATTTGDLIGETQKLLDTLTPPPPTTAIAPPPGANTLVNFPNILAAEHQNPITHNAFAAGVPVTLTAHPTRWRWYADGQLVTDSPGPGTPYDNIHTPQNDPSYYLTHTFTTSGPHTYDLSVTWTATATVTTSNTPIPVTGTITSTTPTRNITALNAHSELIAPTGTTP